MRKKFVYLRHCLTRKYTKKMNEQKINKDFLDLESKDFKQIESILRHYDYDNFDAISCFISSIMGIKRADMLSKDKSEDLLDARYLFWYAMNYMSKKSYKQIADFCTLDGAHFEIGAISKGVNSIRQKIETNPYICNKWLMIKKMIYLKNNPTDYTTGWEKMKRIRPLAEQIIKETST